MKKLENKPIFVDVKFEESLSKEHCLFIMLELVKNLIYQRRQIPLTFETLKREIQKYYNSFANENMENTVVSGNGDCMEIDMKPRDKLRLKKNRIRKQKLKEKFVKKTEKFINEFEKVERSIKTVFSSNVCVKEIALIFGMSPGAPKEVYLIQMPKSCNMSGIHFKELHQRRMLQLFRTVMGHDELFQRISVDLGLNNAFIGLKMSSKLNDLPEHFTPRPELQSWPARTKITTFNIVHDEIFESEVILKKPAFVIGQDSYTPSAMDMCTPFRPQQSNPTTRERTVSGSSFTNEIFLETPCQKQLANSKLVMETPCQKQAANSKLMMETPCQKHAANSKLMIETPCQKQAANFKLSKIEEDFDRLDLDTPSGNTMESPAEEFIWYFCDSVIKGYRDPQVGLQESSAR